jgi:hypothetical protein
MRGIDGLMCWEGTEERGGEEEGVEVVGNGAMDGIIGYINIGILSPVGLGSGERFIFGIWRLWRYVSTLFLVIWAIFDNIWDSV